MLIQRSISNPPPPAPAPLTLVRYTADQLTNMTSECRATIFSLLFAAVFLLVAVLAFLCEWPPLVSIITVLFINLYVVVALIEAALRSRQRRSSCSESKAPVICEFPSRLASLLIIPLFLIAVTIAFGRLYVAEPCGVIHTIPETKSHYNAPRDSIRSCVAGERVEPLQGKLNAIYFSSVTIMTVGYGDFAPSRHATRLLAIWEFATGLLLLVGAFPLLISRLADF